MDNEVEIVKAEMVDEAPFMPTVKEAPQSSLMQAEQARANSEIQAGYIIAKKFPRDLNKVYVSIMEACKRPGLAKEAQWSYRRGNQMLSGPSIRLLEVVAQYYGNLDYGLRELERLPGKSIAEAYCVDLETNTRTRIVFEVPHEVKLRDGSIKRLTDPRDIYEQVANQGSRRMRSRLEAIVPADLVAKAEKACEQTLIAGNGEPLADRVQKMAAAYKVLGVSIEMIEERLKHKLDLVTAEEFVDLTRIYNSIKDKQYAPRDFFNTGEKDDNEQSNIFDAKLSALGGEDGNE